MTLKWKWPNYSKNIKQVFCTFPRFLTHQTVEICKIKKNTGKILNILTPNQKNTKKPNKFNANGSHTKFHKKQNNLYQFFYYYYYCWISQLYFQIKQIKWKNQKLTLQKKRGKIDEEIVKECFFFLFLRCSSINPKCWHRCHIRSSTSRLRSSRGAKPCGAACGCRSP